MNHISIEGMDGVGKTTLCEGLAKAFNLKFIEKPLHYLFDNSENQFENYLKIRDKVNADPNRLFTSWFYALGTIYMYARFKDIGIVTDRHILSNWAWSGTEESKDVFTFLLDHIEQPKATVIVYSTPKVIESRLLSRSRSDSDLSKVKKSDDIYRKMIQFAREMSFTTLLINTSDMTADETLELVSRKLKDNLKKGEFVICNSHGETENGKHFTEFLKTI